jgi:hypothetical protein
MDLMFEIGRVVANLGRKKRFKFVTKHPITTYYRHKLDYQRQSNLPAAYEYFAKNPSSTVDVQSLQLQLSESRIALRSVRDNLAALNGGSAAVPKTVWMYWDRGLHCAPEVVKLSHLSWELHNPDWEVRFLDDATIARYLDVKSILKLSSVDLTPAHKSDFIRTFLLALYGGVWADSTTFCWRPLSAWLLEDASRSGFFVFRQPETNRDRQIANWFIASSIKNPITVGMCHALCEYILKVREVTLNRRSLRSYEGLGVISRAGTGLPLLRAMERDNAYPYFFYHYLFNEVVATGPARAVWQTVQLAPNNFARKDGELGGAYVSKQTYKGEYVSSETYKHRKEKLLSFVARSGCYRNRLLSSA